MKTGVWAVPSVSSSSAASPVTSSAAFLQQSSPRFPQQFDTRFVAQGKMVDMALIFSPGDEAPLGNGIQNAVTSMLSSGDKTVNHSEYGPLVYNPLGMNIETKSHTSTGDGRIQVALWTAAWFNRLETWVSLASSTHGSEKVSMLEAISVMLVKGAEWRLSFFCDRGSSFNLVGNIIIGSSQSYVGTCKIFAALRVIIRWIQTLKTWFEGLFCPGLEGS